MKSESGLTLRHNQFEGERVFLIGSGPSLRSQDLSRLRWEHTCGVNGTHLVADEIGLPLPYTFYGIKETSALNQYGQDAGGARYKFDMLWSRNLISDPSWFKVTRVPSMPQGRFTGDMEGVVATGPSAVYEMLNVMFWLGFTQVYLLGCEESGTEKVQGGNSHVSNLESVNRAGATALAAFDKDGRTLVNLSPGAASSGIPTGSYDSVL
jgi:hypothetical protein